MDSVRNKEGIWINSSVFTEAAQHFKRYGRYTDALYKSSAWVDFWLEEEQKCKNGVEIGGARITGTHYFYLNYCQIKLVSRTNSASRSAVKTKSFPFFWDGDFDYWHTLDIARHGCTQEFLDSLKLYNPPKYIDGGWHLVITKARRKGFSYKNAAKAVHSWTFYPNSRTVIGASDKKYLFPDGTIAMAREFISFLRKHTGFSRRSDEVDQQLHMMASYIEEIDGQKVSGGYKSHLSGISFKNNTDAAKGKDIDTLIIDEAGVFPNLATTWSSTRPALEDGDTVTGQAIIFGTGGDMTSASVDLELFAYAPETYRFMPFENVYDEFGGECCYFFPAYINHPNFTDKQGNSDIAGAMQYEDNYRKDLALKPNGAEAISKRVQEYPQSLTEAFMVKGSSNFPTQKLKARWAKLKANPKLNAAKVFHIFRDEDGVRVSHDVHGLLTPITDFPYKGDNREGAVMIYEHPPAIKPKKSKFTAFYDPYRYDEGESNASIIVCAEKDEERNLPPRIVATYLGRLRTPDDAHALFENLMEYYGCQGMAETNVASVVTYFKRRKKLHLLLSAPTRVINAHVQDSKTTDKDYGVYMTTKLIAASDEYLEQYLKETWVVGGKEYSMVDYIDDMRVCAELAKYNPKSGNYDALSACRLWMLALQNDKITESTQRSSSREEMRSELANFYKRQYNGNY